VGCEGTLYQSRDEAFTFKQADIPFIRRRMVLEVSASPPVRPWGGYNHKTTSAIIKQVRDDLTVDKSSGCPMRSM
jgi:hypothetical protein